MFSKSLLVDVSTSDLVFYGSLLLCITLGSYYRQIDNLDMKRNYGTGVGILITYLLCGSQFYHSILITWGNIIIIKCCDKRYVHQLSLSYTWIYLMYMHYNVDFGRTPYILWIHQTIALRLVGLAFEMYMTDKTKTEPTPSKGNLTSKITLGCMDEEPSAIEIIAYSYYFIGLHRGPYYRWKMFQDHFKTPFGMLGDCRAITEQKLKKAIVYAIFFLVLRAGFPFQMYYDDSFYKAYGSESRYLYNIPHLAMYALQYQVIMMLCTSVCTESGFGVYPVKCLPIPGHGPSARLSLLKLAASKNDVALEQEYNFATLRSFELEKLLIGPRMKDTLRGWDMSTRYWFWAYIYKNINKSNNHIRNALSFLAWSLWCGPTIQQLIISGTLWVHVNLEVEYRDLYVPNASMKVPWDVGFSMMRLFCLVYLTPCFILQDSKIVIRYYHSIFWVYHLILIAFFGAAIIISKTKMTTVSI